MRYTVFPIFVEQGLLIDDLKAATLARTSTGSGLFALLNNGFEQMFRQIVSIREKTLSNTNLEASRHVKKRGSLPVHVRRSKTSLLTSTLLTPDRHLAADSSPVVSKLSLLINDFTDHLLGQRLGYEYISILRTV